MHDDEELQKISPEQRNAEVNLCEKICYGLCLLILGLGLGILFDGKLWELAISDLLRA